MDNFEQLLQLYQDDEDTVSLCHNCNSVIIGHGNFDKHQCKDRITCLGCYGILHTPEDYADHTCTNERRPQFDDEPSTKKAKDIFTCPGCSKVFNTLGSYVDHPCTIRQLSTKKHHDMITCPACYKVFNTLTDYADHRCAKPPTHLGKDEYRLLNLLKLVKICF